MQGKEKTAGPRPIVSLLIILAIILGLGILFGFLRVRFGEVLQGNLVEESGTIDVSFCQVGNCESVFLSALENASSAKCAIYDMDLASIESALSAMNASVVTNNPSQAFPSAPSEGYMHHKFCVLDGRTVLTGSTNPTQNGIFKNDNNLLVIRSPTLARRYLVEFEEIAGRESEQYRKATTTPRYVNLSGILIELRFCPQDACEEAVLRELHAARESVRFMTFSFTSDSIGQALIEASGRGVSVEGVFEKRQAGGQYSEHSRLEEWGIPVLLDANPQSMHHKVFVIDNSTVITGSYNPTRSGTERNDENLLIIHDKDIAREFLDEFDRVWGVSQE